MKRNTLILLLLAAVGGTLLYYYEIKPGKPRDEDPTEVKKDAFGTINRDDITNLKITRGGQVTALEKQNDKWLITQPLNAPADSATIDTLLGDLAGTKVDRELKADAEQRKTYGLNEPAVTLEFKLKSSQQHTIRFGKKDFSEQNAYAQINGAADVALLPASLLINADKPATDFRERAIFSGVTQTDVTAVNLTNENGRIALAKEGENWALKSPVSGAAESAEVSNLLSEVTTAKATEIVSETADDLTKYGLAQPKITFGAKAQNGGEHTLSVGNKAEGTTGDYFAKSSARPQIFKIPAALYEKLNLKPVTLRSKEILKVNQDELTRIQLKNPNLMLTIEPDKDRNKWLIKEPADKKDKEAAQMKILGPLNNRADEVLDKPPATAAAKLAKPPVEIRLTDKSGKTTVVKVSAADGDNVYVRVEGQPQIYKIGKYVLDNLSFKIEEALAQS